jgi:thiamine-monophosphate kinase
MTNPASAEDDFIARYFAPIAGAGGLGLRDDAALMKPPEGCELVLTVDTAVAGVHFFANDPPASIARKVLRVNLSDLAAKGADPAGFLLSFAMPADRNAPERTEEWLAAFSHAMADDAERFNCSLLGGDTVTTPGPLTLSVTAFGTVPVGRMAKRTGARAGDIIFVSGTIGDAALGLQALLNSGDASWNAMDVKDRDYLIGRYREPQPRNCLAQAVRECANGSMDVSDGLAGDLAKMVRVSGVSARIRIVDVPLSPAALRVTGVNPVLLDTALTGGDDYEILCTVSPCAANAFRTAAAKAGVPVTAIGEVVSKQEQDAVFVEENGTIRVFQRGSYSHF